MSLYHIDKNCPFPITLLNSGNLADDFNKYAEGFAYINRPSQNTINQVLLYHRFLLHLRPNNELHSLPH